MKTNSIPEQIAHALIRIKNPTSNIVNMDYSGPRNVVISNKTHRKHLRQLQIKSEKLEKLIKSSTSDFPDGWIRELAAVIYAIQVLNSVSISPDYVGRNG